MKKTNEGLNAFILLLYDRCLYLRPYLKHIDIAFTLTKYVRQSKYSHNYAYGIYICTINKTNC